MKAFSTSCRLRGSCRRFPMTPITGHDFGASGCFDSKGSCAVVMAPANAPVHVSNLMQSFSARAYRGRTVRFRAWIRVEGSAPDDHAQMWLSVDRSNDQKGFFDNMSDRPIRSSSWVSSEIQTRIDDDATFIKFGVMSVGRGHVRGRRRLVRDDSVITRRTFHAVPTGDVCLCADARSGEAV